MITAHSTNIIKPVTFDTLSKSNFHLLLIRLNRTTNCLLTTKEPNRIEATVVFKGTVLETDAGKMSYQVPRNLRSISSRNTCKYSCCLGNPPRKHPRFWVLYYLAIVCSA
ncbi:hypothetical protein CEXT_467211 [Caerostris extrusa]|uniref:Uncharacterized protein n=1 Tax=Caerostris extrusa TaxID=172846 RepID=A0AAV4WCL4_CAEEX|nr:hypothetical protein CEXT_467211 [Caerostris extrusa]